MPSSLPPRGWGASMMRMGSGSAWVVLSCLLLGACGVEQVAEEDVTGTVTSSLEDPNYANAVGEGTTALVLNPQAAVGAPDGVFATLPSEAGEGLMLDLGEGQESSGILEVYTQGPVGSSAQATVQFLTADGGYFSSGVLYLRSRWEGVDMQYVWYSQTIPYRYVVIRSVAGKPFNVDAVVARRRAICGDGVIYGTGELCDDGNQLSGDGCNSICRVETGYTCSGEPSVCVDRDECALGTHACPANTVCVNTPGSYVCQ